MRPHRDRALGQSPVTVRRQGIRRQAGPQDDAVREWVTRGDAKGERATGVHRRLGKRLAQRGEGQPDGRSRADAGELHEPSTVQAHRTIAFQPLIRCHVTLSSNLFPGYRFPRYGTYVYDIWALALLMTAPGVAAGETRGQYVSMSTNPRMPSLPLCTAVDGVRCDVLIRDVEGASRGVDREEPPCRSVPMSC